MSEEKNPFVGMFVGMAVAAGIAAGVKAGADQLGALLKTPEGKTLTAKVLAKLDDADAHETMRIVEQAPALLLAISDSIAEMTNEGGAS